MAIAVRGLLYCFATPASPYGRHQLAPVREAGHGRSQDMQGQNNNYPCGTYRKGLSAVF